MNTCKIFIRFNRTDINNIDDNESYPICICLDDIKRFEPYDGDNEVTMVTLFDDTEIGVYCPFEEFVDRINNSVVGRVI